jgi:aminoglycoside/choline kinase family phosphotransferase
MTPTLPLHTPCANFLDDAIEPFLQEHNWGDAERLPLPQDCSARSYIRLLKKRESRLLMVDPPPLSKLPQFITASHLLSESGFRTPIIFAHDGQHLALIEDLGDLTFTKWLSQGFPIEPLYDVGIDILVKLRKTFTGHLPSIGTYSLDIYLKELELFHQWFYPSLMGKELEKNAYNDLCNLFSQALEIATKGQPQTLTLRDFHIDNMMVLGSAPTIDHCGLLDFQDALNGPCAYDLTSLLQDSRSPISDDFIDDMMALYFAKCDLSPGEIDKETMAYHTLGAQRNIKNLGVFARMFCLKDKPGYLKFIPRLWENIDTNLKHPLMGEVRRWMDDYIPRSHRHKPLLKLAGISQ